MNPADSHEGGLSVRDQIERYRSAFIAVVTMIVIAAVVGGYILAHENLILPGWVPVLGKNYYTLKADFQTAQALTPGPGPGGDDRRREDRGNRERRPARRGRDGDDAPDPEVRAPLPRHDAADASEDQPAGHDGRGRPGHARHRAAAQRLHACRSPRPPRTSTSTSSWRAWTPKRASTCRSCWRARAKASATTARRSRRRSSASTRPRATSREIAQQLEIRHANTARSIHNFRLLIEALGEKDTQLAQLVDASNAVFAVFAKQEQNVESLLRLLPGALAKTEDGPGQARHRRQRARPDPARARSRSRARSAPPRKPRGGWPNRPRRSSRTRSGRSRAKSCRSSRRSSPPPSS